MPKPPDTYLDQGKRNRMCEYLQKKGITDTNVLEAMHKVPRHWFVDPTMISQAYDDTAIIIGCEQTISHPSTVAMQSQLLEVAKGMKVLEIGTGSGYQTAILSVMGARVFTIERQKELFDKTRKKLNDLNYSAKCYLGDGYQGLTEVDYGLFDRIIITCGAPYIPPALMHQLRIDGIMVIPVGEKQQEMLRIIKKGESQDQWVIEKFGTFQFVPMLNGRKF